MELRIFNDHHQLSDAAASQMVDLLESKRDAVICLASGETPRLTCRLFVEKALQQKTDTTQFTFIGLDEWVGISPANEGSCHYFFQQELIQPLQLTPSQVYLFDAMSGNLGEECTKMDELIAAKGGIDLMIVGIGMNGHIGFNEPGVSFENNAHVADLDDTTIQVGQKYFKTATSLKQGITLGLKHLQRSKKVILMANGAKKAGVIRQTIRGDLGNNFPATIMQTIAHGTVMVDKEAASLLDTTG